jgi:hypothetical protein
MARRGRKYIALKYGAVAVIAAAVTAFFFLHKNIENTVLPTLVHVPVLTAAKPQQPKPGTGYKEEDREKLEKLIHNGGKDD